MRNSYYADNGYIHVQLPAPRSLVERLNEQSRRLGMTKREIFRMALTDFLRRYEDMAPVCQATFKKPDAAKIRIWVDPDLAELLKELAARSHVTVRAMVYTALLMRLGDPQQSGAMR